MIRPPRSKAALLRKLETLKRFPLTKSCNGLRCCRASGPRSVDSRTADAGVLPGATFNQMMARDRFREITRFFHFTDNTDPAAATDRAWKIRSVLSVLERSFKDGYVLGSRVAIEEGILPCHKSRKPPPPS
ncbi:PiggyBac transposable element-derived protein [Phytophthora cactorum]|nr:PiggyBac transposable element-derived protein [Phytophthora cactorum]